VALLGVCRRRVGAELARSFGRDAGAAFALAVLNSPRPGVAHRAMHNDAVMLGCSLPASALARRGIRARNRLVRRRGRGQGPVSPRVVFIGWEWAGAHASPRRRARHVIGSLVVLWR